ncbi:MAG TPA: hypothetical protein PKN76_08615, partial [bacterium]|nr:hypothetical protein [bacterium]
MVKRTGVITFGGNPLTLAGNEIKDFYICKYEVTQGEYEELMGKNLSYLKGDNLPVESVTWYDAV